MQGLLRRSVLVFGIFLISATGLGDAAPRANERPDVTVVPLLDPMAMPESAVPVARAATASRSASAIRFPYVPQSEYLPTQTNYGKAGAARRSITSLSTTPTSATNERFERSTTSRPT
jgi:hypothetical protein